MTKIFTIVFSAFFLFFFADNVLADVQTFIAPAGYDVDASTNIFTGSRGMTSSCTMAQSFVPNQPFLSKTKFGMLDDSSSTCTDCVFVTLCRGGVNIDSSSATSSECGENELVSTATGSISFELTSAGFRYVANIDWGSDLPVDQGVIYYYIIGTESDKTVYVELIGDYYTDGSFYNNCGTGSGYDLLFANYLPTAENSIEITGPPIGFEGNSYKDFDNWQIEYSLFPDDPSASDDFGVCYYWINVYYGTTTDLLIGYDSEWVEAGSGSIYIPKKNKLSTGKYYAQAIAWDYCTTSESTTTAEYSGPFWINNISGDDATWEPGYQYAAPDVGWCDPVVVCEDVATSSGTYFDDFRYGIECGGRRAGCWFLQPSQGSISSLSGAFLTFKKKFPFNSYFDLIDSVEVGLSSTTLTQDDTLGVPFITATGSIYIMPVLSSSSIPNAIGTTNATLFRVSVGYIIWLVVSIIIIIHIKRT